MCSPPLTVLGNPTEPLSVYGALLLGELIGYTVETQRRLRHLTLHERDKQSKQLQTEAETFKRDIAKLRDIAKNKDNFVASLSHEMRTVSDTPSLRAPA